MSRERPMLAVLFADLVRSTQLYDTLGNPTAQAIVNRCLDLLARVCVHYGGTVVKTIGDEIMCTFSRADDAVQAAQEMNKSLSALSFPELPGFQAPNIHTGVEYGAVIHQAGDVFGDVVNTASGLAGLAKPRQILAGCAAVAALAPKTRRSARLNDRTVIKGKGGELEIYEIIWEQQDVTLVLAPGPDTPEARGGIDLRFRDQFLSVDSRRPSAGLGRQPHNDIVVPNDRVSRSHARVEYRRGRFFLIDQSTNGTFVTVEGKPTVLVHREELALSGNGRIGLGQAVAPDSIDAIRYSVKDA